MFHLFGALAQFEREIIRDRTMAGLAAARARGRNGGRPSKLSADQVRAARRWSTPWSRSAASSGQPHLYIPGVARQAGSGEPGGRHRGSVPATLDVDSWAAGALVIRPGERLVTVLVTLAVPAGGRRGGRRRPGRRRCCQDRARGRVRCRGGRPSASTGQSGRPPRRGSALAGEGGVEEHRNPDRLERHAGAVAAEQAGPGPTGRNR